MVTGSRRAQVVGFGTVFTQQSHVGRQHDAGHAAPAAADRGCALCGRHPAARVWHVSEVYKSVYAAASEAAPAGAWAVLEPVTITS